MSEYILCSKCKKKCPHTGGVKKRYFTTTQYGGNLCSVSCCVSWITLCKIQKIQPQIVDMTVVGTFTIVCSKVLESSRILYHC